VSLEGLKEIYKAEQQIISAYSQMIAASSSAETKQIFMEYRQRSEEHIRQLQRVLCPPKRNGKNQ